MANLPDGSFLTTIGGRRCTAVPRGAAISPPQQTSRPSQPSTEQPETEEPEQEEDDQPPPPVESSSVEPPQVKPSSSSVLAPTTTRQQVLNPVVTSGPDEPIPPSDDDAASSPTPTSADGAASNLPADGSSTVELVGSETSSAGNNDNAGGAIFTSGSADELAFITTGSSDTVFPGPDPTGNFDGGSVKQDDGDSSPPIATIIGGVLGALFGLVFIALFIWFWRRRARKHRRDTMLAPLAMYPEKRRPEWEFDNDSLGPTPRREVFAAAVGSNVRKLGDSLRWPFGSSKSRFIEISTHSRANSMLSVRVDSPVFSKRDRFNDWWSRLAADVDFNWRLRHRQDLDNTTDVFHAGGGQIRRDMTSQDGSQQQPDFFTLLSKEDTHTGREMKRQRAELKPRPGSETSIDHFLGGLALDIDSTNANGPDPFSDTHAVPAALAAFGAHVNNNNPFADANAVAVPPAAAPAPAATTMRTSPPSGTYIADIRRSRGLSESISRSPSSTSRTTRTRQHSVASTVGSFETRREKWRSDPFDLALPRKSSLEGQQYPVPILENDAAISPISSSSSSTTSHNKTSGGATRKEGVDVVPPPNARVRSRESFSSRYTSGMADDWGEPGPDVGGDGAVGYGRQSGGSVGKAL